MSFCYLLYRMLLKFGNDEALNGVWVFTSFIRCLSLRGKDFKANACHVKKIFTKRKNINNAKQQRLMRQAENSFRILT